MNWKSEIIQILEGNIKEAILLIGDYRKKLLCEDDPGKKQNIQNKIQELMEEIERTGAEIIKLERMQATEGKDYSLEIPHEDIHEALPEEVKATDVEDIYETLPEEVKPVVEKLRQSLEQAKGQTFTFLLVGKTGVGKSSTVNSLMGANVAPVRDFDPCTVDVTTYEKDLNGAIVRVIDTPGLCDDLEEVGKDAEYIELIRKKISYPIDAVFFVTRLDEPRVDANEKRGLRLITKAFGELFWKKSVIVFTWIKWQTHVLRNI